MLKQVRHPTSFPELAKMKEARYPLQDHLYAKTLIVLELEGSQRKTAVEFWQLADGARFLGVWFPGAETGGLEMYRSVC